MLETELKLAAHASFVIRPQDLEPAGIFSVEELAPQDLRATYYDTADLRLARNGSTLRYRRGGDDDGWDLKLPVDRDSDIAIRDEIHLSGPPGKIPDKIRDLTIAAARSSSLSATATLRTRRNRMLLKDIDGAEVALICDDEVSVLEGRRIVSRFREIEIEASAGVSNEAIKRIGDALVVAGAVVSEPIPKVVRALGPRAMAGTEAAPGDAPGPKDPGSAALTHAFRSSLARLIAHDPAARLGDAEGVHQMRVAARRFRSDLRTFETLLDPAIRDQVVEEIRWLAEVLGEVRDMDVQIERLRGKGQTPLELLDLFRQLEEQRSEARTKLMETLAGRRYVRLLDSLTEIAESPLTTTEASRPCAEVLPACVWGTWKKLSEIAGGCNPTSPDEDLHEARIRAKRLRYAAEAVAPSLGSLGKEASVVAKAAAELQDVLGIHQDASVSCTIIERFLEKNDPGPRGQFVAGRLFERQVQDMEDARAMFPQAWQRLDRKKLRRWMKPA